MSIVYDYFGGLYINLTNKCPNACEFCIRNFTDSLGDADSLVLKEDPTIEEVRKELASWDAEHRKFMETVPDTFNVLHYAAIAVLKRRDYR